ncbi:prefoldin subunit alpha [Methanomethylovorans sp.]|uniref:prefoldin subunit alpha n=1 Tax=Methanomethylovorans sp. TaxID=2758717 RepID=UPI00351BF87B
MAEMNDTDPRNLLMQHREYQRRAEALQQQISMVSLSAQDCQRAITTIEELEKEKADAQTMVPIGSGSFVYAKLEMIDKVVVNVGAGISIEKSVAESKEILQRRKDELDKILEKMNTALAQLAHGMQAIEAQVTALQQGAQSSTQ